MHSKKMQDSEKSQDSKKNSTIYPKRSLSYNSLRFAKLQFAEGGIDPSPGPDRVKTSILMRAKCR